MVVSRSQEELELVVLVVVVLVMSISTRGGGAGVFVQVRRMKERKINGVFSVFGGARERESATSYESHTRGTLNNTN